MSSTGQPISLVVKMPESLTHRLPLYHVSDETYQDNHNHGICPVIIRAEQNHFYIIKAEQN